MPGVFLNRPAPNLSLSDLQASVFKRCGQEVNLFKLGRMPAQVLIEKTGMWRGLSITGTA